MDPNALNFDRSGLFYPAVMNYWVLLHGAFELLSRGFIRIIDGTDVDGPSTDEPAAKKIADAYADPAARHVTKIFDAPQLLTSGQPERITPPGADELSHELFAEHQYILGPVTAGGNLLIVGHQAAKAEGYTDKNDPTWEFLRHCRNGAAHNGRFNLLNGEPKQPAHWRGLTITPNLHGTPVFKDTQGEGFLALGDPLLCCSISRKPTPT
jgi:hypothetical protein